MVHLANTIYTLSVFLIAFIYAEHTYKFEVYVSSLPWSDTVDEIFFRLCNTDDICGKFQSVPAGWQSVGQSYSYKYTTNTDIGDIYKVQIVHTGSDMLCIGHIKVNDIEYDENEWDWIDWPHCIEEAAGGGCDTVTIILPDNDWNSVLTIPCEYELLLHNPETYSPIKSPTKSPIRTSKPTINPIISPSENPTISPIKNPRVTKTETNVAAAAGEQNSDGNYYGALIGGVIGALVAFVLCLSLIIIIICYWMRQKQTKEINEINNDCKCVTSQSTISSYEGIVEGTMNRKGHTMANAIIISPKQDNINKERIQLIADNSSDESQEELYDNQRRNMTKRIPSDDEDLLLDEDVVPK